MSGGRPTLKSKSSPDQGSAEPIETSFAEVAGLIEQARERAYQAVNSELVGLYWRIGEHIRAKLAAAVWGEGVVDHPAQHPYLARTMPGQRGCTRRNHNGVPFINTVTPGLIATGITHHIMLIL